MLLPSITPMNAYPLQNALEVLRRVRNTFENGFNGTASEALLDYQRTTTQAGKELGFIFSLSDLEQIILTRRHWLLLNTVVIDNGPMVLDLIRAEIDDRERYLKTLIEQFEDCSRRWHNVPGPIVVPDTNFYLHHEVYFDAAGWNALVDHQSEGRIRVLIPMAVVLELDRQKRAAKNIPVSETNSEPIRTRARITGRRLGELFPQPHRIVHVTHNADAELLLDPSGHRPIDDTDAEIIDRALAARNLTGRNITILTGDNNMKFAARTAGLDIISLPD